MSHKNNPLRVSLQFSKDDDCQVKAIEILNQKGRKKALYISQAIELYEKKHELTGMSISEMKNIVEDLIRNKLNSIDISALEKNENTTAIVVDDVKRIKNKDEQSFTIPIAPSIGCNSPINEENEDMSKEVANGEDNAMKSYISEILEGFMNY